MVFGMKCEFRKSKLKLKISFSSGFCSLPVANFDWNHFHCFVKKELDFLKYVTWFKCTRKFDTSMCLPVYGFMYGLRATNCRIFVIHFKWWILVSSSFSDSNGTICPRKIRSPNYKVKQQWCPAHEYTIVYAVRHGLASVWIECKQYVWF